MGEEDSFHNAFATYGIIPEKYGYRTALEHRALLVTLPPENSAHEGNSQGANERDPQSTPDRYPILSSSSSMEVESALRQLGAMLDATGMSAIDPRYLVTLRAQRLPKPSADRAGLSRRANTAPTRVATPPRVATPTGLGARVLQYVAAAVGAGDGGGAGADGLPQVSMSWHWADARLALVTGDDAVRVYNVRRGEWEHPPRAHASVREMRAVAFRPFATDTLAVACSAGVALWEKGTLRMLVAPRHTRVVALHWSPDGARLASTSAAEATVRLWDVGSGSSVTVGSGGLSLFSAHPTGDILLVASATRATFRLWRIDNWTAERWGSLAGAVRTAAWAPDGSLLMLAAAGESAVHVLRVRDAEGKTETDIVHTEITSIPETGPGGCAQHIAWDPHGERVAIVFDIPAADSVAEPLTAPHDDYAVDEHRRYAVALYSTTLTPTFSMSPIGYVSGPPRSGPPTGVAFKPRCEGRTGAVLACSWASGAVTFTQLIFWSVKTSTSWS